MHKHILIPTDGSELSQKAIDYAMALAKSVNAKVTVVTVSAPCRTYGEAARGSHDHARGKVAAFPV